MLNITLRNIQIKQKNDKNGSDYFIIVNEDNKDAYFCFAKLMPDDFENLKNNWQNIEEVSLEYEEDDRGKRVLKLSNPS